MLRKRGGWLTLLFLGEMLTATAMGWFEEQLASSPRARPVRAVDYQQRRECRVAGHNAGHSRDGARRNHASGLVARGPS